MSASCQPAANHNKCSAWKVASNLDTCQNLATPQGPYHTIDSCQTNSATCANAAGGIYARWGASAPIRPGPMAKGAHASPYPYCRSYEFSAAKNQCEEVPHTTPGATAGPQSCVGAHSPFVYNGPTF
jgi:hypothetical protein